MEQNDKTGKGSYLPPPWASLPKHPGYYVEVLKNGKIEERHPLRDKSFYTIGRQQDSDLVVQHPSLSRHHCVIQFGDGEDKTFLCDLGSTHGTFLNKSQLKPLEYSPIKLIPTRPTDVRILTYRDGDMFKLGYSTRIYIFVETQLEDEREVEARRGVKRPNEEITWGMAEEAVPVFDYSEIEWREYAETNTLTSKQQKLAEKITKLERHKEKIQLENKKIQEKESKFEELTPEQIATLLENERRMEQLNAEIDELEESIQTSILEKINPSRAKARIERKEEENSGSDDEFYDRTKKSRSVKTKPTTAEDLISEKKSLKERLVELESTNKDVEEDNSSKLKEKEEDSLDAFMSDLDATAKTKKRQDRVAEKEKIKSRLDEIEKLLDYIDPDLFYSRE